MVKEFKIRRSGLFHKCNINVIFIFTLTFAAAGHHVYMLKENDMVLLQYSEVLVKIVYDSSLDSFKIVEVFISFWENNLADSFSKLFLCL